MSFLLIEGNKGTDRINVFTLWFSLIEPSIPTPEDEPQIPPFLCCILRLHSSLLLELSPWKTWLMFLSNLAFSRRVTTELQQLNFEMLVEQFNNQRSIEQSKFLRRIALVTHKLNNLKNQSNQFKPNRYNQPLHQNSIFHKSIKTIHHTL